MVSRSLDRRREVESDVQPRFFRRMLGRSGLAVVRLECNEEEIVVASARSFAPGTQVFTGRHSGRSGETIITEPPPGRRGASAFPLQVVTREFDSLGIVSADPPTVEEGTTTAVTLTGFGFRESPADAFRAVRGVDDSGAWLDDPEVTVDSVTWLDAETVEAVITVAAGAVEVDPTTGDPVPRFVSLEVERA